MKTDRFVAGTVIVIITRLSCEYLTSPNSFEDVGFEVYDDLNSKFRLRHASRVPPFDRVSRFLQSLIEADATGDLPPGIYGIQGCNNSGPPS